nr:unnamed protein product [Naegleria fowleri]
MAEQMNVDLGQSPFMISQPTATFNNNSIVVSNLGKAHQSLNNGNPNQLNGTSIARSYNTSKRANERTGGDGTFLTEVSINNNNSNNDNYDNRIVYNNLIETPQPLRQSPVFGKARIYPPIQELANYMNALNRKVQQKKFSGIDQRNSLHQPIVVHSYKDSQFNNGLRKLPPPPKKDAFYPLKKLNKRKQIEELAAELSKKDNFEHDFSKHSINNEDDKVSVRSKHSSTSSKSKTLPPLNPNTREQMSDAISQAFSDLNPDAVAESPTKPINDDKFDTKSIFSTRSKYSQKSRKSKLSELSFSIGSDAESDRIRQLEHSLKHEEEARRNILKILEEIQQKQEFLLNKLSQQEREQFESIYGRYNNLISDLKKNSDDNLSVALSAKDIQELKKQQSDVGDDEQQREHLPKIDKSDVHSTASRKSVAKSEHGSIHSGFSRPSQALSTHSNHSQRSQESAFSHHLRHSQKNQFREH